MKRQALCHLTIAAALSMITVLPAAAQTASTQLIINFDGPTDHRHIEYQCEGLDERLPVEYLNSAPNFLAILTVDDQRLIFSSVIAASGVRYASGKYVWWTKGAEASLYDETADEDAGPMLTCLEANDIP